MIEPRQPSILLAEDEPDLSAAICESLGREGFAVSVVATGAGALARVQEAVTPDLVLLDMTLPDMPGTEVCKLLRADPRTRVLPIVIISARAEEIDRVVGFELGADDFISKPFSLRELVLRLRAILRRNAGAPAAMDRITCGRVSIDEQRHRAWVDDRELVLTALEFRLLLQFMRHRGQVLSRERLLTDVWGLSAEVTTRTVDTHVLRLRDRLGEATGQLQTLRGVGYRFTATDEPGRDLG